MNTHTMQVILINYFQRDIVKKIVLFFICATLGVSNAYGRDGRDIAAELSTASSVIYKTYKQGGITSVIGTISKWVIPPKKAST